MVEDSVLKGNKLYDLLARDGRRVLKGEWDLDKYTLKNFILESLASDPSNPLAGRLWYNSVDGLARYWDGTKVRTLLGNFQLAGGTPTPETVGEAGSFGVSTDGIPIDHVHAGVRSLCKKLSAQLMGDVKLIAGTNITLNQDTPNKEIEIVAGGGGAPTDASYVTIGTEAGLSNETLHENIGEIHKHTPKAHTHVEADITNLAHDDVNAIHDDETAEISAIAEKGTPVDADLLLIEDSAAANAKKKVQIGNLPGGGGASFVVSGAQAFSGLSPTSWTDLDLSSIVGSNSAMVILRFHSGADINAIAVRKNGDTNDYYCASADANAYGCALGHHDSTADLVLICVTDTAGIIEWICESGVSPTTVDVIAYIK